MFWADLWVHFPSKSHHASMVSFWRHHVDLQTLAAFLKKIHMKEVHHRNVYKSENGDVRRRRGHISVIQVFLPSGLTQDWNQQNVTRMFQEHLLILGMVLNSIGCLKLLLNLSFTLRKCCRCAPLLCTWCY